MKYHLIYTAEKERKVLEVDTDAAPPNVGDYVQLPFGNNQELCLYCAADIYYSPVSQEKVIYYIDVRPV